MLQHDLGEVEDQPYETRWARGPDGDTWVYEELVPEESA